MLIDPKVVDNEWKETEVKEVREEQQSQAITAECRSLCLWAEPNQAEPSRHKPSWAGPPCSCRQAAGWKGEEDENENLLQVRCIGVAVID